MSEFFHAPSLISRKREGEEIDGGEIRRLIERFTSGNVTDAQMSAFAMAVYFRGMTAAETAALTYAMLESGERFVFPGEHPPIVDKHSTGGIGDKVSLILAPLVACCDCWIPMVSGRGLGITGGTLDKLESIPGFRVNLTIEQAMRQLEQIQVAMMGQTEQFCPADKKLYALRDVTGTVPSIPLITASIMSKKLAESLDRLVLDVKYGSGAFMKTREQAIVLADAMVAVGVEMGVEVSTELNSMQEPLGHAVGNVLEVIESIKIMQGGGPKDLLALVLSQAEKITKISQNQLLAKIQSGQVLEKFVFVLNLN
jgi:pyrimidine-nucleoside phosphorylase